MRKQNRSARNGRASRSPSRANTAPALASPPCWVAAGGAARSGRGRRGSRVLAAEPVEGLAEEAQLGRAAGRDLAQPAGVGRPQRRPGGGAQVEGLGGQRVAASSRPGLPGLELAQPAEVGDAGVLADADQPDPVGATPRSPSAARIWASWSWSYRSASNQSR